MREIYLKLTIKTPKWLAFIDKPGQISSIVRAPPLLALNK